MNHFSVPVENMYLEAPKYLDLFEYDKLETKSIFLAGSITGAWNWQKIATEKLLPYFNIVNPRRENYVWSESEEYHQIEWEYIHLNIANIKYFYFSSETLAPITLFEYGKELGRGINNISELVICIHPEYKRKNDVIIQTELQLGKEFVKERIFSDFDESLEFLIKKFNK